MASRLSMGLLEDFDDMDYGKEACPTKNGKRDVPILIHRLPQAINLDDYNICPMMAVIDLLEKYQKEGIILKMQ